MDKREYFDNPKTERVKWIMHRGIRILSIDHSNTRWDDDHVMILQTAAKMKSAENAVSYLVDLTGCYLFVSLCNGV